MREEEKMRKNSIKKILTIVISYLVVLSVITMFKGACVEAKTKTVEGTRVEAKHKR